MSHKEVLVLLCFVGLSLVFCEPMKVFAQAGKSIDLRCHVKDNAEWRKDDDKLILKFRQGSPTYGGPLYNEHYKLLSPPDNMTMKINRVALSDAGRYTCSGQGGRSEHLQLSVFEIKASATTLLTSDNLTLSLLIAPEKSSDFQVTWELPNAPPIHKTFNLEVSSVSEQHTGIYKCYVSQQGTKVILTVDIFVAGFRSGPDSQYMSSGSPLYIPWNFNFPIRDSQPWRGIKAVMGNVSYSSGNTEPFRTLLELRVSDTGTCWPENCAEKPSKGTEKDLGFTVTKPGHYLMVVWLKLGEKIKPFQRKVCLPRLIVSASPSVLITWDINTTIHCQTSCRITNGVLQWKHDREIRAERQEDSLPLDVAPHLVNMGIWTCILSIDKQTKMSENITLEIKPLVTLGSGMPFWLIVGASIFLLVVVVLSICLLRSHCRRKRLARRRVWLLQSLRQHRTCKCKRFSPELREIY